ncbi:MAG: DUF2505 domain-containing protein [Pseudomonadota bacterium]
MTQVLHEVHKYPQDAEALIQVYIDKDAIVQRYEGVDARDVKVRECSEKNGEYTVRTEREVRADVPGALAKFAKEWNHVEQKETWVSKGDGVYDCHFSVHITGLPVDIKGHMVVQPDGDGSLNDIELTISCAIPLIGRKAEEFVSGDSKKSMDKEHEWIKGYLAG